MIATFASLFFLHGHIKQKEKETGEFSFEESRLQCAHESPPPPVLPANQRKETRLEEGGHLKNKILLLP